MLKAYIVKEGIWLYEFCTAHATLLLDAYVYILHIETNLLEPVLKDYTNLWHRYTKILVIRQVTLMLLWRNTS